MKKTSKSTFFLQNHASSVFYCQHSIFVVTKKKQEEKKTAPAETKTTTMRVWLLAACVLGVAAQRFAMTPSGICSVSGLRLAVDALDSHLRSSNGACSVRRAPQQPSTCSQRSCAARYRHCVDLGRRVQRLERRCDAPRAVWRTFGARARDLLRRAALHRVPHSSHSIGCRSAGV